MQELIFNVEGKIKKKKKASYKDFFKETLILLKTSFDCASVLTAALGLHWVAGPAPSASALLLLLLLLFFVILESFVALNTIKNGRNLFVGIHV